MKGYRQFLNELPSKKVVFAFGRFNPPTKGHELLVKAVRKLSVGNVDHVIYVSKTQDQKKNPLPVDRKVYYLNRMFRQTNFIAANDQVRTFIEAAKLLNRKYKDIIMVAGSDRVNEFKRLLEKYNGIEYKFNSIQVVSAGARDPDSDDLSGMSATKMREAAKKGDFLTFKRGLPNTMTVLDARRLMNEVREGLGLEPVRESIKFSVDQIREKYFQGEIFNEGDMVAEGDSTFEVVKRGTNHLLVRDDDGNLESKWLSDVQPLEEKKFPKVRKDKDSGEPEKYVAGLSKSTAKARSAHWDKMDKLSDKNPAAYKPAPGDATAETKPSKYTKKYKQMYGEGTELKENKELIEMSQQFKFTAQDKIKVARIIATTLGVESTSSNPKELVNRGLREIRKKPLTKNGYAILNNMLKTARLAGIDYDDKLIPQQARNIKEEVELEESMDKTSLGHLAAKHFDHTGNHMYGDHVGHSDSTMAKHKKAADTIHAHVAKKYGKSTADAMKKHSVAMNHHDNEGTGDYKKSVQHHKDFVKKHLGGHGSAEHKAYKKNIYGGQDMGGETHAHVKESTMISPLKKIRMDKEKADRAKKEAPKRNPGTGLKSFKEIKEGYAKNRAQQAAIAIAKKEKGEYNEDMYSADKKPGKDGRPKPAHRINFANSGSDATRHAQSKAEKEAEKREKYYKDKYKDDEKADQKLAKLGIVNQEEFYKTELEQLRKDAAEERKMRNIDELSKSLKTESHKVTHSDQSSPGKGKALKDMSKDDHIKSMEHHEREQMIAHKKGQDWNAKHHAMMAKVHRVNATGGSSMMHKESVEVDKNSDYNIAKSILSYKDMMKLLGKEAYEKVPNAYQDDDFESMVQLDKNHQPETTETGHTLDGVKTDNDHLRRRKVDYHLGEAKLSVAQASVPNTMTDLAKDFLEKNRNNRRAIEAFAKMIGKKVTYQGSRVIIEEFGADEMDIVLEWYVDLQEETPAEKNLRHRKDLADLERSIRKSGSMDKDTQAAIDAKHKQLALQKASMHEETGEKVECPKCEGEGCDHCDDKGYHINEAKEKSIKHLKQTPEIKADQPTPHKAGFDAFFEEDEVDDIEDDEIDKMVDDMDDDEILDTAYDDDDVILVDPETGEEDEDDEDEKKMDEAVVVEVLSRMERIRAKQRLKRTSAKRKRATKIALRKYSSNKVLNNRARRLAVKALKKRFTKGRDMKKLSVAEKERLERLVKQKSSVINRIAVKMRPRVRKLEKARLQRKK